MDTLRHKVTKFIQTFGVKPDDDPEIRSIKGFIPLNLALSK